MKTHFNYKELSLLYELTKDDLRRVYQEMARYKSFEEIKPTSKDLLVKADLLEDVLEKLAVGKTKCKMKYKAMVEFSKKKKPH
tara:strand:- start:4213 stop:4461 length:249 start_codon:yes stop_codon:yes gene_type:complete